MVYLSIFLISKPIYPRKTWQVGWGACSSGEGRSGHGHCLHNRRWSWNLQRETTEEGHHLGLRRDPQERMGIGKLKLIKCLHGSMRNRGVVFLCIMSTKPYRPSFTVVKNSKRQFGLVYICNFFFPKTI